MQPPIAFATETGESPHINHAISGNKGKIGAILTPERSSSETSFCSFSIAVGPAPEAAAKNHDAKNKGTAIHQLISTARCLTFLCTDTCGGKLKFDQRNHHSQRRSAAEGIKGTDGRIQFHASIFDAKANYPSSSDRRRLRWRINPFALGGAIDNAS